MKENNLKISQAARHKFLILLLLTLALIFDLVYRQPNLETLEEQSLPEMPAAK